MMTSDQLELQEAAQDLADAIAQGEPHDLALIRLEEAATQVDCAGYYALAWDGAWNQPWFRFRDALRAMVSAMVADHYEPRHLAEVMAAGDVLSRSRASVPIPFHPGAVEGFTQPLN